MSQEKVLMKGNEAMAEAAIRAGCRFFFGYPITPQTEVAAYMAKRMPKEGGTYLQAESEIAAINMVYGASSAGARVMTSSSSPGVSLKGEGVSYMAATFPASSSTCSAAARALAAFSPLNPTTGRPPALWAMAISRCSCSRLPPYRRWPIWRTWPSRRPMSTACRP